jgi:hypothetical protein
MTPPEIVEVAGAEASLPEESIVCLLHPFRKRIVTIARAVNFTIILTLFIIFPLRNIIETSL